MAVKLKRCAGVSGCGNNIICKTSVKSGNEAGVLQGLRPRPTGSAYCIIPRYISRFHLYFFTSEQCSNNFTDHFVNALAMRAKGWKPVLPSWNTAMASYCEPGMPIFGAINIGTGYFEGCRLLIKAYPQSVQKKE